MFHWTHGLYFGRLNEKGDVMLKLGEQGLWFTIPAAEWGSIVASVSARGECRETWDEAQAFHNQAP